MGITAGRGAILTGESSAYLSGLGKAYREQKLIFILTAPQPRNAATVSAVVAKGMKLELELNASAKASAEAYARYTHLNKSSGELSAFSVLPAGAHVFENSLGIFQGYAVAGKKHLLIMLPCDPSELEACFAEDMTRLLTKFDEMNAPPSKLAVITSKMKKRSAAQSVERVSDNMPRTNLIGRLRTGKLTKNDKVRLVAVVIFLVIFMCCMFYIGTVFKESADNENLSSDLKDIFTTQVSTDKIKGGYPRNYLKKFAGLYEQNPDVAGWIKIPDTKLDYVVVQGGDNAYYERRDFTRKKNDHGVPFIDYRVDQSLPSTNTVIYAHNMNDGQMFGELMNYKQLSFYQKHPVIEYDSIYSENKYKIFGIVLCKKDDPDFSYHNFIEKGSDQEMTDYVNKIRERSLINTKVDMRTDDTIITLSTCDYSFKSSEGDRIARFVVFARRIRPGESEAVDVAGASINTNPIMPAEWYAKLAQQQAAELKKQQEAQASSAAAAVNSKWLLEGEASELSAQEQKQLTDK
ncbi:MAG: class B sortase, partial [Angelakisella sp.]